MNSHFLITILLCAGITISVRAFPIVFLSKFNFPTLVQEWLNFVPASIMSAIIAAELIAKPSYTQAGWSVSVLATIVCITIGIFTRSLFLTVIAGIAAFMLFGWAMP